MSVYTNIRLREPHFIQKALHTLTGIAYQRAAANAFCRTGIRCHAYHPCRAIETATVKYRSPIEPEIFFEGGMIR